MGSRVPVKPTEWRRAAGIRSALLRWYDTERRDLPWRRDRDPYRVWVSEVMLQQTRVDTVIPYYERWLDRFPSVSVLADATEDDVLAAWAGLGYYRRARALHEAARMVRDLHEGAVPPDPSVLRTLPGVGAYTAGAIASIAFDRAAPAVDGNARRVLARLHDLADPAPAELERSATTLGAGDRPGDLNQALMELGATVCAPLAAACSLCPVARWCRARARGTTLERPVARRRRTVPHYEVGTAVVVADGLALVGRRPVTGMLGGMWEFPGAVASHRESTAAAALRVVSALTGMSVPRRSSNVSSYRRLAVVEHAYSHRRHTYHAYRFELPVELVANDSTAPPRIEGCPAWTSLAWRGIARLDALPMGAAQRRIAGALPETP